MQKQLLSARLIFGACLGFAPLAALADAPTTVPALATSLSVDQLKTEAFHALKSGEFGRTSDLLTQAAAATNDSNLTQMSQWLQQFQSQRVQLAADRAKAREKASDDVKKLLDDKYPDYAFDKLRDACLLADDKEAFCVEPWVADLMKQAEARAVDDEAQEQWLKARQLYSDLSAMQPTHVEWKNKFKAMANRIRLLAMYTPDDLKKTVDAEFKQRESAEQLINPSTQPTTKPEMAENDSFKIDWHDTLHGVQMSMLAVALKYAQEDYWRDVDYKILTRGGLKSVIALASTHGLEKSFPGLGDDDKRKGFIEAINRGIGLIDRADASKEESVARGILKDLLAVNKNSIDLPEEVIVSEFAEGAFAELDPFSTVIWPDDLEEFNRSTQGEFSGVGIQIQSDPDNGDLKVVSPVEDSPAYRMHIHAGDVIAQINGKSAKGITTFQAVKSITGPSGTYVTLTIKSPDGTMKDYSIRRETIKQASVKGYQREAGGAWDYFVEPTQKIAYVRLTMFSKSTEDELNHALAEIQKEGAKAIVIDLRANPGGLLNAATAVCDRFLSSGTIVSTKSDRDQPMQPPIEARQSNDDIKLPVVVLVNQLSASASEIVSGALQDQHRALVVGERSFGKGSVQMMFPLGQERNAALKLTTSHYYLPSGRCLHKDDNSTQWGVEPDVKVEMTVDQLRSAQEAQQNSEILRETPVAAATTGPTTSPSDKRLAVDPQLSAAVLLLRLELAGATL